MIKTRAVAVIVTLAIILTACNPLLPPVSSEPGRTDRTPTKTVPDRDRQDHYEQLMAFYRAIQLRDFYAALRYQQILAFAAAVEANRVAQAQAQASQNSVWDRLAKCESGGNWAINSGNGYYGGIQFSLSSWRGVGGTGYPHQHSRETQIAMGERLRAHGGWGHWPGCARRLGLL